MEELKLNIKKVTYKDGAIATVVSVGSFHVSGLIVGGQVAKEEDLGDMTAKEIEQTTKSILKDAKIKRDKEDKDKQKG